VKRFFDSGEQRVDPEALLGQGHPDKFGPLDLPKETRNQNPENTKLKL
jgi:hypothetical protein